jgi:serine phosphatase RsbU (regulator of sigma subunit)
MTHTDLIDDLATLNQIAETLNRAVDVRSVLDSALVRLVELMGLETGWLFLSDPSAQGRWWGRGYVLAAHHNLPPALALDNPDAWDKGCDCQGFCNTGRLSGAYNEVRCSRLAEVSGDRRGLTVHASAPLRSGDRILGILNVAGPDWTAFSPEALALLTNVGAQMGIALERARLFDLVQEQLRREEIERQRLEEELRVARLVQQTLLPREVPALPGWEIAAYYQPARSVGGDFYDFLELPDGRLGLTVGDVADKGAPAALMMAATRSILRAAGRQWVSPGQVLEQVNDLLYPDIPINMFVTCLYAVLDPASGRLQYANAGHPLPYLRTACGAVELQAGGMPLGMMPHMHYEENEIALALGEGLLFYSDGLVEAHNSEREMFGFPRLETLVAKHPGGSALIDFLLAELAAFAGSDWEQEDDVMLLTLHRSRSE